MKRFKTKITILILSFAIGVSAVAIWIVKFKPDPIIYSVEFNELMRESKNYDSKIVEIQAWYVQGIEAAFLSDSNRKEFITATCFLGKESCTKVFASLRQSLERQEKITVVGRYRDSEYQEYDGYVHTIEILEVKLINTLQTNQ